MSKRDERLKATDVFNKTNFVFSRKVSFSEAFPMIETIVAKVTEDGEGTWSFGKQRARQYDSQSLGEYINCSNKFCYNGGFSIGQMIRGMVSSGETQSKDSFFCQGYEGSPKGRHRYRSCTNRFEAVVEIKYKKAT
jgi:hypothetical protein